MIEWHGTHGYAVCADCGKLVRVNKPIVGSIHLCKTDCEKAGRHLDPRTRRSGPFWRRRVERYCGRCYGAA